MFKSLAIAAAAALAFAAPASAAEQTNGRAIVSLYHVAPGHQVMFLKWLAAQDRVSASVGIAPGQLYAHTDGDSWDYMVVFPMTTSAQDDALDAAAKKMGLPNGPGAGLELRKHIASHTDTLVRGPISASDYLKMVGEK